MALAQRRSFLGLPKASESLASAAVPAQNAPSAALPPLAVIVLNRLAYGPRQGEIDAFNQLGASDAARLAAWVGQQLSPDTIDDAECQQALSNARLKIRYDAYTDSSDSSKSYPARNDAAPLGFVLSAKSNDELTQELWPRSQYNISMNYYERTRPFDEVRVATWIRAVQSKRQLYEVLVDFWHNHFSVNGTSESPIMATFPVYDRIIRANALGNFRSFLEAIAKSTAMMYSLDNYNNRASGAEGGNENYARELFELHTFGSDNYYKFYDDRTAIPKLDDGVTPAGYIDDDVYEAASCLTGWTINNSTGLYTFNESYHYEGVKEVLGTLIRTRDVGAENEAKLVFDMLAKHPKVAGYVCKKLCRRLIADEPPQAAIDAAVATWLANLDNPNQLREVVRTIVTSAEFAAAWAQKVKRPFEAVVAYLRATGAQLPVDLTSYDGKESGGGFWSTIMYQMSGTGHKLFEWPTPTGHPDISTYWISSNSTLRRWNLPFLLVQSWGGNITTPEISGWDPTNETRSVTQIVDAWIARMFGYAISDTVRSQVIAFFAQGGDAAQPPAPTAKAPDWGKSDGLKQRYQAMIQLLAASPEFHSR